jgi:hypothetical protein
VSPPVTAPRAWPAGWPLRHFTIEQLGRLLAMGTPRLVELSKDALDGDISLKALARHLSEYRAAHAFDLAFAATTDLVGCAGFPWERYRQYLGVQIAQARFLECTHFRLLLGHPSPAVPLHDLIDRVVTTCADLEPMRAVVEIHAGVESDPVVLAALVHRTPVAFLVDLDNMLRGGLTLETLLAIVPAERIAYFHLRNLEDVWIEHPTALVEERRCRTRFPNGTFLWEPKTVNDPERILELYGEHATAD